MTPMDPDQPIYRDPAYLWAQGLATRRMVRALANCLDVAPEWRQQSQQDIQRLRELLLAQSIPESALVAMDEALRFVGGEAPP